MTPKDKQLLSIILGLPIIVTVIMFLVQYFFHGR